AGAPQEKKEPAAGPGKAALAPGLRERFRATEQPKEQQGMVSLINVKEGGTFFSADGTTLYIQRGGGFGAGAFAGFGGGGGGFGGGMRPANLNPELLSVWNIAARKKTKEIVGCQVAVLSPNGDRIAMAGVFDNKRLLRLVNAKTGEVMQSVELPAPLP